MPNLADTAREARAILSHFAATGEGYPDSSEQGNGESKFFQRSKVRYLPTHVRKPSGSTKRSPPLSEFGDGFGMRSALPPNLRWWLFKLAVEALRLIDFQHRFIEENLVIHEVSGDILLSKAQAIAHGIAPNDHFDSGLALSLRERWPAMAKDFRHYAHQVHPKPGELWVWSGVGGIRIFNLLTQEGEHGHGTKPGRASVENINHSLKRLRHEIDKLGIKSLAISKLGTGVGGLDWKDVQPLIVQHLGDAGIPVYVYTAYHKDQQATEA